MSAHAKKKQGPTTGNAAPCPGAKPAGAFRVLHTGDWHLGKMLGEHSREEEHRQFLRFLLDSIREHAVDALIIAGDVFDSANPPQTAVTQYYDFLSELYRQGDCSVVIVAGNHDSTAHLEAPRRVLKSLRTHVVGAWSSDPAHLLIPLPSPEAPRLLVAAVPFLRDRDLRTGQWGQTATEIQQALAQGINQRYREAFEASRAYAGRGVPILATGHLTVAGAQSSESEREIHVGGLGAVRVDSFPPEFAYVALGHFHRPQRVGGREQVRYAGSPIALSFSEATDAKEMRLLDFLGEQLLRQTALPVPPVRPLAQLCTTRASLVADLKSFCPPTGKLPAWVEVVVDDPLPGENLYDLVQSFAANASYEVIRVTGRRTNAAFGMATDVQADLPDIDNWLGDPAKVFDHRLQAENGLSDEERLALKTVFQELLELHSEQQRNGAGEGRIPRQPAAGKTA